MELRTHWEFEVIEAISVSNEHLMQWNYTPTKSAKWMTWGQDWISSRWNASTHHLRVQHGWNEVSIKLAAHGIWLCTSWEFKVVETRSVWDEQPLECDYAHSENSKWLKKVSMEWTAHGMWLLTCREFKVVDMRSVSNQRADGMALHTNWEFKVDKTGSVLNNQDEMELPTSREVKVVWMRSVSN
jgi:hypothetical protein